MSQVFTKKFFAMLMPTLLLGGCASINSVSLTPIPSQRSNTVKTEVSKLIFLGFNFDNDFIDPIVDDLKRQCPNGVVSGVLTKDETISYFLVFRKKVTATGFCNVAAKTAVNSKKPRHPSSNNDTVEE